MTARSSGLLAPVAANMAPAPTATHTASVTAPDALIVFSNSLLTWKAA